MSRRRLAIAAFIALPLSLGAQLPAAPAEPGSELTISLMTMGNGSEVWELFGHNAIWIHDARSGTDAVWNWGVFNSRVPHFILHFLKGRMFYSMAGDGLDETLASYRYLNRSVAAQELNLTPAERLQVKNFIDWNARPENRDYRYDYFQDNCSTRVRDVLDRVLGGAIARAAKTRASGTSYRGETLRLMQGDRPLVVGVEIGLGRPADRPITVWEDMFLPRRLHDFLRTL